MRKTIFSSNELTPPPRRKWMVWGKITFYYLLKHFCGKPNQPTSNSICLFQNWQKSLLGPKFDMLRVVVGPGERRGLKLTLPLFFFKQFFSTWRDNGLGDFNGLVHGRGLIYTPPLHAGARVVFSPSLHIFCSGLKKHVDSQIFLNFLQWIRIFKNYIHPCVHGVEMLKWKPWN